MDDIKEKAADLSGHVEDLADTFYRLAVLNLTQKASNIISGAVVMITLFFLGFFILFFLGFALAWWLGDIINSRAGGFLLAAAFFSIIVLSISLFRKKTIFPLIRNLIIRKMYD